MFFMLKFCKFFSRTSGSLFRTSGNNNNIKIRKNIDIAVARVQFFATEALLKKFKNVSQFFLSSPFRKTGGRSIDILAKKNYYTYLLVLWPQRTGPCTFLISVFEKSFSKNNFSNKLIKNIHKVKTFF